MFSKIGSMIKGLTKRAVGYVRGLNGEKIAQFLTKAASSYLGPYVDVLRPFAMKAGEYLNEQMDKYAEVSENRRRGGVNRMTRMQREIEQATRKVGGEGTSYPAIEAAREKASRWETSKEEVD